MGLKPDAWSGKKKRTKNHLKRKKGAWGRIPFRDFISLQEKTTKGGDSFCQQGVQRHSNPLSRGVIYFASKTALFFRKRLSSEDFLFRRRLCAFPKKGRKEDSRKMAD